MITKENLYKFFDEISSLNNLSLNLFAIIKDGDETTNKKIDIDSDTADGLISKYSSLAKSYLGGEKVFKEIGEYDDEANNVYYYFDQCTDEMGFIKDVSWDIQDKFSIDELKKIDGIIVKVGNQDKFCNLYIPYYSIYLMDREKWAMIFPDDSQFKTFESDKILRFNNQITFLYYKDQQENLVLSFDFEKIEKYFGYEKEFINRANTKIEAIGNLGFVSDISELKGYVDNKKALRSKLIKIKETSEVLNKSTSEIKTFVESKTFLKDKVKFDNDDKITITSEEKARTFLKLLDDDYLRSDLTDGEYESDKKSPMS